MGVVTYMMYGLVCDMCGHESSNWEFVSKEGALQDAQGDGWALDGKKLYCEPCGDRVGWWCHKCNSWYRKPGPADGVCPDCAKTIALATKPPEAPVVEVPARWVRGGDGTHWDGCYSVHWDCAIYVLRDVIDDALNRVGTWGSKPYMEYVRKVYLETGNE